MLFWNKKIWGGRGVDAGSRTARGRKSCCRDPYPALPAACCRGPWPLRGAAGQPLFHLQLSGPLHFLNQPRASKSPLARSLDRAAGPRARSEALWGKRRHAARWRGCCFLQLTWLLLVPFVRGMPSGLPEPAQILGRPLHGTSLCLLQEEGLVRRGGPAGLFGCVVVVVVVG